MATSLGDLVVFFDGDFSGIEAAARQAQQHTAQFAKTAERNMKAAGKSFEDAGRALALRVTAPLVAAGVAMVKFASDAEETANKFNVVFRDVAKGAEQATNSLAHGFGLARSEAQMLLSDTGDLLTGFGFTQEAALDLSSQVNELAADLASFTNVQGGTKVASQALTKALLGERESAKALGIAILEADVQAKVLQLRQQGMTFDTDRQAKAYATLQIAMEQSKNAQGDFARSSASLANQWRILLSRVRDARDEIGRQLLPVAKQLVTWAIDMNDRLSQLNPRALRLGIVIAAVAAAVGPLLIALGKITQWGGSFLGMAGRLISGLFGLASTFFGLLSPVLLVVAAVGLMIAATSDLIDWGGVLGGMWDWVVDKFRAVARFFGEFGAFLKDENAAISKNSETTIAFIAKAWLSLKIAWQTVKLAFLTVVKGITRGLEKLVSGFAAVAEFVGLDTLAEGARGAAAALEDFIVKEEDVIKQNEETLRSLFGQWGDAPKVLRNDINALVDTFKALPDGILKQIESAFPGMVEKLKALFAKVQGFIDTGEIPGLSVPIDIFPTGDPSAGGAAAPGQAGAAAALGFFEMAVLTINQKVREMQAAGETAIAIQAFVNEAILSAEIQFNELRLANATSFNEAFSASMALWALNTQATFQSVAQFAIEVWDKMVEGISDGVATMIVEGKSFAATMKTLFKQLVSAIISQLVKWTIATIFESGKRIAIKETETVAIIAADQAQTVANAAAAAPHPFLIPVFVGLAFVAFAAAMSGTSFGGGGGGGGGSAEASVSAVSTTRESEIIREEIPTSTQGEGGGLADGATIIIPLDESNNAEVLVGRVVRDTKNGVGDGSDVLSIQDRNA